MSSTLATLRTDTDILKRVDQLGKSLHRSRNWLINEAIKDYLSHQEWFVNEVEEAIRMADTGEFADESEVKRRFKKLGVDY